MVIRQDRIKRSRAKIRRSGVHSIIVTRSAKHMSAQLVDGKGVVITGLSTMSPDLRGKHPNGGNVAAAKALGLAFAAVITKLNLGDDMHIAFDRSGYKYHGRIQALADGLREGQIQL